MIVLFEVLMTLINKWSQKQMTPSGQYVFDCHFYSYAASTDFSWWSSRVMPTYLSQSASYSWYSGFKTDAWNRFHSLFPLAMFVRASIKQPKLSKKLFATDTADIVCMGHWYSILQIYRESTLPNVTNNRIKPCAVVYSSSVSVMVSTWVNPTR